MARPHFNSVVQIQERSEMPFSSQTPWFVRSESRGMIPHGGGMIGGSGLGRADQLPISVPSGAYVVPADIVAGIGQGNSQAGGAILARAFGSGPLGMPVMHGHGGFGGPKNIRMGVAKLPRGAGTGSIFSPTRYQQGGSVLDPTSGPYLDNPTNQELARRFRSSPSASRFEILQEDMEQRQRTRPDIPVQQQPKNIARGGSHPAPPGHTPIVAASGEYVIPSSWIIQRYGDLKTGHDILDKLMLLLRKKHVREIAKLPPPVKR
jgi:hypothetical protein